jgi:hypothetical protein
LRGGQFNSLILLQLKNYGGQETFGKSSALISARLGRVSWVCRGTGEMSCKDTIHLICWYLERKLSPSVENEIERHLSQCRDCHLVLDAANTTLDRYFEPARQSDREAVTEVA